MAIVKRNSSSKGTRWQVKVRDVTGEYFPTQTFDELRLAKAYELSLKKKAIEGEQARKSVDQVRVGDFFDVWVHRLNKISDGWRKDRVRDFQNFVDPFLGDMKLKLVRPADVADVLRNMQSLGKSAQTQLHIYNLMRKLFNDAIEDDQILNASPVLRKFKPVLHRKERPYLSVEESRRLLQYVEGKSYELVIWINLVMGNRIGEIISLKWIDVDLEAGELLVRSTYNRKEKRIKDYPKGGKQYKLTLQAEVIEKLREAYNSRKSEFVCPGSSGGIMSYHSYYAILKRYCREAGVTEVATHGLRHSTSGIWRDAGATRDDIQKLFNHSSATVTVRYLHETDERLSGVARNLRLIKTEERGVDVPKSVPKSENLDVDPQQQSC